MSGRFCHPSTGAQEPNSPVSPPSSPLGSDVTPQYTSSSSPAVSTLQIHEFSSSPSLPRLPRPSERTPLPSGHASSRDDDSSSWVDSSSPAASASSRCMLPRPLQVASSKQTYHPRSTRDRNPRFEASSDPHPSPATPSLSQFDHQSQEEMVRNLDLTMISIYESVECLLKSLRDFQNHLPKGGATLESSLRGPTRDQTHRPSHTAQTDERRLDHRDFFRRQHREHVPSKLPLRQGRVPPNCSGPQVMSLGNSSGDLSQRRRAKPIRDGLTTNFSRPRPKEDFAGSPHLHMRESAAAKGINEQPSPHSGAEYRELQSPLPVHTTRGFPNVESHLACAAKKPSHDDAWMV